MNHFVKKISCFLLAFLLSADTAVTAPVPANAAVKNIVKPDTWEVASANVPVVKDFTLPSDSSDVYIKIGVNAPAAFTIMIFDGNDMEVDSVQITETDSEWKADSNKVYINGYQNNFESGTYHAAVTFDVPTAFQFSVTADIREAAISNSTLTLTEGFSKTISVKENTGKIKWKSSKPAIATVDKNGKVTAKKAGRCTITASVDGKTLKCTVTVKTNKYSAPKLTTEDLQDGRASLKVYRAAYDGQGNLVIKFRLVNNCGHYVEYLQNFSVKVKTAKGTTAATYKESKKTLYVADQSFIDFSITISKEKLKIKKRIDLVNASIILNGTLKYDTY